MRYTVLTSRMFHNRITRYLGVLVGAALVAVAGAAECRAQAQTPAAPTVHRCCGRRHTPIASVAIALTCRRAGSWIAPTCHHGQTGWKVEYTAPGE